MIEFSLGQICTALPKHRMPFNHPMMSMKRMMVRQVLQSWANLYTPQSTLYCWLTVRLAQVAMKRSIEIPCWRAKDTACFYQVKIRSFCDAQKSRWCLRHCRNPEYTCIKGRYRSLAIYWTFEKATMWGPRPEHALIGDNATNPVIYWLRQNAPMQLLNAQNFLQHGKFHKTGKGLLLGGRSHAPTKGPRIHSSGTNPRTLQYTKRERKSQWD